MNYLIIHQFTSCILLCDEILYSMIVMAQTEKDFQASSPIGTWFNNKLLLSPYCFYYFCSLGVSLINNVCVCNLCMFYCYSMFLRGECAMKEAKLSASWLESLCGWASINMHQMSLKSAWSMEIRLKESW